MTKIKQSRDWQVRAYCYCEISLNIEPFQLVRINDNVILIISYQNILNLSFMSTLGYDWPRLRLNSEL